MKRSSGTATEAIRSVIERYADAWQRRDPAAFALYHPQFTIHWFGHNPLSGTHVGAEQVQRALGELARRTNRSLVKIVATLAGPERGAIIARESFGVGDARVEVDRVLIFTVADEPSARMLGLRCRPDPARSLLRYKLIPTVSAASYPTVSAARAATVRYNLPREAAAAGGSAV